MKHKFLIENDIGLSLDKVKFLLQEKEDYGGELYGSNYDDVFEEIISHLQQALDNLGENE